MLLKASAKQSSSVLHLGYNKSQSQSTWKGSSSTSKPTSSYRPGPMGTSHTIRSSAKPSASPEKNGDWVSIQEHAPEIRGFLIFFTVIEIFWIYFYCKVNSYV
mmetsp:Transcript_24777/g.38569  ORF Transcript_24777/g.38569 Transcript_24777/m.38569 type:complete len:103 (+) Transcript_24777:300-608(+)